MRRGRTALVTGASGGLGREFVRLFAADGFDVALVARRGAPLEELAQEVEARHGVAAHVLPVDLARPTGPAQAIGELATRGVGVDALVNCAGSRLAGPFAECDELQVLEGMQVNLTALTHLTRLVLPGMIRRRWGRIVTLSSASVLRPGPMVAQAQACRAYALALAMGLSEELRGSGVRVTALCPAPAGPALRWAATNASRGDARDRSSAAEVAAWGYAQVKRGDPFAIQGPRWRALALGARYLPRWAGRTGHRVPA